MQSLSAFIRHAYAGLGGEAIAPTGRRSRGAAIDPESQNKRYNRAAELSQASPIMAFVRGADPFRRVTMGLQRQPSIIPNSRPQEAPPSSIVERTEDDDDDDDDDDGDGETIELQHQPSFTPDERPQIDSPSRLVESLGEGATAAKSLDDGPHPSPRPDHVGTRDEEVGAAPWTLEATAALSGTSSPSLSEYEIDRVDRPPPVPVKDAQESEHDNRSSPVVDYVSDSSDEEDYVEARLHQRV
ncbi:hypothetical protein LTR16_002437 [Cryomyces antarcticus]|uniref:Uncharacterized protein n=1 Tax=Cryomyces antarcticus TaxID=329879 RepID=A0ABR0KT93_9PEZI|nr:hypothetical protein LTR16_002437 [Cryomyces antarcticus]